MALHFHGGGSPHSGLSPAYLRKSRQHGRDDSPLARIRDFASNQAVEHAIMAGRGNVDLLLTPKQYERLVG